MAKVFISIGSNIEREKYIRAGVSALNRIFGPITCSPVYESIAVGFEGDNFYNLVVGFETSESVESVNQQLTDIEDANDRVRSGPRFSGRTLDLDLLIYGDLILKTNSLEIPRSEIFENAFVLLPLADIAAEEKDPLSGKTFDSLWREYDKEKQDLWKIPFDFDL